MIKIQDKKRLGTSPISIHLLSMLLLVNSKPLVDLKMFLKKNLGIRQLFMC